MRFQAVWLGALLASALPARAQLPRCEGTITQSGDGAPVRANVFFQPPDSLKIEVLDSQNGVVKTVVASGDQTQTFDSRNKRLSVLGANMAREWFRGATLAAGGPANFAFVGATGFQAQPDQGVTHVRDRVLLGNDERRSFYVASKQRVRAFPVRITIENGVRTDFDDLKLPLLSAKITLDPQKIPTRAVVGSGGDAITFDYALKPRATDFPADTFTLPADAQSAIREETTLRAPSTYRDENNDDTWNHGLSLWQASGDAQGAQALWARVILANPRATAPRWSSLDVALSIRNAQAAARALEGLKPLLSEADLAWASIPADELRADRKTLLADLERASTTGEPDRKFALALARRAAGNIDGARVLWKELLADSVPHVVQVRAAENLALSATQAELATLGQSVEGQGEGAQLARALIDLRGGKTTSVQLGSSALRSALARGLERAGQNDAARALWESLESTDSVTAQNEARAHLVSLLARKGDAGEALTIWNRWYATLVFDTQKNRAQSILFDAFQKAGKIDALRLLLSNRASATNLKEQDLRLRLAYEETYGTEQSIAFAQNAGYERFPNVAFWQGKRAETIVANAFLYPPKDSAGFRRRAATFKEASNLLDKAIATSPEPTFYTLQKALIKIQRATGIGGVLDPGDVTQANDEARAALAGLDASDDPDYRDVAAVGWNSFPADEDRARGLVSARVALNSAPGDGDRSTLIFAARQVTAQVLENKGDSISAAKQWAILLDLAQSADDEAGLVAALLNGMDRRKDAMGMTQLLVRVATERWPLDAGAALVGGASGRIAVSPLLPTVNQSINALAEAGDNSDTTKAAIVARAALSLSRLQQAAAVVAIPGSPPTADAELTRATQALTPAISALKSLAEGNDPFWATRARLLLIDAGTLAPDQRRELLQQLAQTQGGEPSVVLSLANASTDASDRVKAAQTLDFDVETWRRLALDALAAGDKENADFWSREAFEFASNAPEAGSESFQRIAFARARVAWAISQAPTATAIYNALAGKGWNNISRAAALLALRKRLTDAGNTDEAKSLDQRIAALSLDKDDAQAALSLRDDFDN